jgi:hypothetical protein
MAIFTSSNQLDKQKKYRNFKKATGWKAGVMNVAGYNADGTKNTWGKIQPPGFGASSGIAADIASTDSDAKEVLKENRSGLVATQLASAKLAMNFIPGGTAMKIGADVGLSAGQNAASGSSKENAVEDAVRDTEAFEKTGSSLVDEMNDQAANDSAMKSMDEGIESSSILNDVSDVNDIDNYATEADYLSASGGGDAMGGVAKGQKLKDGISKFKGGNFMKGVNAASGVASIAGDAANLVQTSNAYNKGLEKSKDNLMRETLNDAYQNYL